MRIATWNLRQDIFSNLVSVSDSIANLPSRNNAPVYLIASWIELPWSVRRIRMAQYLETKAISVIGVQEALVRQVKDLSELFGSDWAWVGVGRDDGQQRGEYNAIFYNTYVLVKLSPLTCINTLSAGRTYSSSQTIPSGYPKRPQNHPNIRVQALFVLPQSPSLLQAMKHSL